MSTCFIFVKYHKDQMEERSQSLCDIAHVIIFRNDLPISKIYLKDYFTNYLKQVVSYPESNAKMEFRRCLKLSKTHTVNVCPILSSYLAAVDIKNLSFPSQQQTTELCLSCVEIFQVPLTQVQRYRPSVLTGFAADIYSQMFTSKLIS